MIDHVPFAWHDLEEITAEFTRLGLKPVYGGEHGNGLTHMAVLGFDDHSYIELISEIERGDHRFWPQHIRADAGPAAWSVRVPDIVDVCVSAIESGMAVDGPHHGSRVRDDGTLVEWDLAMFQMNSSDRLLPFAIADRTPLSYRVEPSPCVTGGAFNGIGEVVMAVEDVDSAIEVFESVYRFPAPISSVIPGFGRVSSFPGRPVTLLEATDPDDWAATRLADIGGGPCTCLLETDRLDEVSDRFPISEVVDWPDGRVVFFESDLVGKQLGTIEKNSQSAGNAWI